MYSNQYKNSISSTCYVGGNMQSLRVLAVIICIVAGIAGQAWAQDQEAAEEILFVQSAASFTVEGSTLTLTGVQDTLWFTDRPERKAGTMANEKFFELWMTGDLHQDPPNAVLSVPGETPLNVVVELAKNLGTDNGSLHYEVEVLWGELPANGGPCSLFIDADIVNPQITD